MSDLINIIQSKIISKIFFDYDMSKSTWFRTGGRASAYTVINNIKDLKTILSFKKKINYYIIGVGSNLLIRDNGFDGLIIKLGKNFNKIKLKQNMLSVGAGVLDVNLAKFAQKNSIKNFEFYSGIPGTIGGAVKMNAGCYGSETSDILNRILLINKLGELKYLDVKDLNLGYRSSKIDEKSIILKADFKLDYGSYDDIKFKNNEIKFKRKTSQPLDKKTSGSTFKNPPGKFAAVLIEKSGCKGMVIGGASISNLHSNFIINNGNASAKDIEKLGKAVIEKVKQKFGITLDWEIKILGD